MRRRVDSAHPAKKAPKPRPKSHTPEVREARAQYRNGADAHPEPDDPLMVEKLLLGIKSGLPPSNAATMAGIAPRQWRMWRTKAEIHAAGGKGREKYGELFRKVELARTEAMAATLATWWNYGAKAEDWRAFEARAKRLYPAEFGDKSHVTVDLVEGEATRLREIIVRKVGADVAESIFDEFVQGPGGAVEPAEEGPEGG